MVGGEWGSGALSVHGVAVASERGAGMQQERQQH